MIPLCASTPFSERLIIDLRVKFKRICRYHNKCNNVEIVIKRSPKCSLVNLEFRASIELEETDPLIYPGCTIEKKEKNLFVSRLRKKIIMATDSIRNNSQDR